MKLIGYEFDNEFYKSKENLDKAIKEYKKHYRIDESDMFISPTIVYNEVYEYENGMTANELELEIGVELSKDKKYVYIPRTITFNVEEKLKKNFKGYRYYSYLKENGEDIKTIPIFDGYAFEIDLNDGRVLIGCDDFGSTKYKILDKESQDYKNLK